MKPSQPAWAAWTEITLRRLYEGIDADIEKEITADIIGDYVFTDEAFVKNLSTKQPNIFQKIYNHIKHLVKMATAGSKEAKQLEQIKNTFDKAYNEMGKASEVDSNLTAEDGSDTKSHSKYNLSEDKGLYKYINEALSGKLPKKSFYKLSTNISDRLANEIEKIVGFSVKGYSNEISPGNIEHIDKRHGANGIQDHSMSDLHDLAKIGYVIENFDKIREGKLSTQYRNSDMSKAKTIELQKKIDDEYYYVVEAVPDANMKTLHVVSAYKNKKDTFSEEAVPNGPSRYVQDEAQSNASSKQSIHDNNRKDNIKYSLSDNHGRKLTKEQQEYFKDSKVRDENGNLLTVYHGSKNKFNVFTSDINWFSSSK